MPNRNSPVSKVSGYVLGDRGTIPDITSRPLMGISYPMAAGVSLLGDKPVGV
jgi:hypothetical protein